MEILNVNLARRRHHLRSKDYVLLGAAALILLIISGYHLYLGIGYRSEINAYSVKISRIEQDQQQKKRVIKENQQRWNEAAIFSIRDTTAFINHLIAKDVFPWIQLLSELERRIPPGVTIQKLTPSDNASHIGFEGFSSSTNDISLMLNNLEATELFDKIKISNIGFPERNLGEGLEESGFETEDIHFSVTVALDMAAVFGRGRSQGLETALSDRKQTPPKK